MRLVTFVSIAVFLIWEVITRGGAAYLAEASPEKALGLQPTQATALINLAEKKLRETAPKKAEPQAKPDAIPAEDVGDQPNRLPAAQDEPRKQTLAKISSLAELALVNDPLNARALGILGRLALQASDDKRADVFMQAAARRSLFESEAIDWMMVKSYQSKGFQAAIKYANILFKTRQNVFGHLMPMLGNIAENQDAAEALQQALINNAEWKDNFFRTLPGSVSDARTPLVLYLRLKNTSARPTLAELSGYLNFLVERKFYDLAYYTWLQFLPSDQLSNVGNLFNGSFENAPTGAPFDWVWRENPSTTIELSIPPDRKEGRALYIAFGAGRVDFPKTTELVMLPPGSYQLRGSYKADLLSERGLQWRVACAGGDAVLGEGLPVKGQTSAWRDFEFSFTVPEAECSAQYVTLVSAARSASETFISGTAWFDDLKIVNETVVAPLTNKL
jgi:hypothetical protein